MEGLTSTKSGGHRQIDTTRFGKRAKSPIGVDSVSQKSETSPFPAKGNGSWKSHRFELSFVTLDSGKDAVSSRCALTI